MPRLEPAMTLTPAGSRVLVRTSNGAAVEGVLLYSSAMEYGCDFPILRTDEGWTYNYRYAVATAPTGAEFSPIPGAVAMELLAA